MPLFRVAGECLCLAHKRPNIFPFEPPVVRTPDPAENPIISLIRSIRDFSINVAIGANSYVYIEVCARVDITSPAKAAGEKPPQRGFRKFG